MIQKVIKVGSSLGATFNKQVLQDLGLSAGDEIKVTSDPTSKKVTIEPNKEVRPEIVEWTDQFIKDNRELLEALKDS